MHAVVACLVPPPHSAAIVSVAWPALCWGFLLVFCTGLGARAGRATRQLEQATSPISRVLFGLVLGAQHCTRGGAWSTSRAIVCQWAWASQSFQQWCAAVVGIVYSHLVNELRAVCVAWVLRLTDCDCDLRACSYVDRAGVSTSCPQSVARAAHHGVVRDSPPHHTHDRAGTGAALHSAQHPDARKEGASRCRWLRVVPRLRTAWRSFTPTV